MIVPLTLALSTFLTIILSLSPARLITKLEKKLHDIENKWEGIMYLMFNMVENSEKVWKMLFCILPQKIPF